MFLKVLGLGLRIWASDWSSGVWGLGFRVWGAGNKLWHLGFKINWALSSGILVWCYDFGRLTSL